MTKSITNNLLSLLLLLNSIMFAKSFTQLALRTAIPRAAAASSAAPASSTTAAAAIAARLSLSPSPTSSRWMSAPTEGDAGPSVVDTCREKISVALETEDVKVLGAYDDPNGSHISIEVTSALFEGKRPVQRQQLVYKALWEELKGAVHAVDSMVCKTPAEK